MDLVGLLTPTTHGVVVCGGPEPEGSDGLAPYGAASPTNRYANKRRSFSTKPASHDAMRRPGGFCGVAAPDPIPNSAVKRPSAHDTSSQDAGKSVAARSAHRISSRHSTPPTPRSASRQRGVRAFAHRLRSNPPNAIHLSKRDRTPERVEKTPARHNRQHVQRPQTQTRRHTGIPPRQTRTPTRRKPRRKRPRMIPRHNRQPTPTPQLDRRRPYNLVQPTLRHAIRDPTT